MECFQVSRRSNHGAKPGSGHLQIRSLWAPEPQRRPGLPEASQPERVAPHDAVASRSHQLPVPAAPAGAIQDWPIGLRGVRPGVAYTRGVPSPRVAGQQWEDQFRTKLVAAIEQRKRRAYLSVCLAGGGVLALVACFAALLALRGVEEAGEDLAQAALPGAPPAVTQARPRLAGAIEAPSLSNAVAPRGRKQFQQSFDAARQDAMLESASTGQDVMPAFVPSGTSVPARIVSTPGADAAARPAPTAAPRVMRTRLRIIGETINEIGAMIVLRGFPEGITLSVGMSPSPGTWVLGLEGARDLQIVSPADYQGRFRASLEVIGPGGVALLRQDAEITVPASALVIVLPGVPASAAPAAQPAKRAPQLHARDAAGPVRPVAGARMDGEAARMAVPDKSLGTQIAVEDNSFPVAQPAGQSASVATRRTVAPPAYGLGGPR